MNESNPSLEEALFEVAVAKSTAAERAAFLDGVCRDNPALRARLDVLLEGHFQAEAFLGGESKKVEDRPEPIPPATEDASTFIGRYKLLEKLGEGGFGEVWMAEQKEPVKRRVALKIIKLGMDTKQVVARFEAERQALALMDHPNIAKVFDAGATDTGRPYFVMELVRGERITEFCDKNQVTTQERLNLFIQVCRAIQHAHQKGIIHRDIKPSNILVTLHDGVPVPKVIDFGIAKATQQELTEKTVFTQFRQFLGTPAYISPEQAEMSGLDIDTRSDIYSLGVLLYELLTGLTPFDTQELLRAGLEGLRKVIRENQPLRPSTRLSGMAKEELTTRAKRHGAEPPKLLGLVRGDLDWIVMKCLEKDRARRYATANGLAADIERHLRNEPVVARPPSRLYEFQKTVRRHKFGFGAVTAIIVVLAVSAVVSWTEVVHTHRAERRAVLVGASEAKARSLAEQRLYEAKLGEARAKRLSGVAGQRFESLTAITEAAAIHGSSELRDEAIACLALPDLRVQKTFQVPSRGAADNTQFDSRFELYAYPTPSGIRVHRASSGEEAFFLSSNHSFRELCFDPLSRYLAAETEDEGNRPTTSWQVWSLTNGGALALEVVGQTVAFTPDGEKLAVAKDDGTVSIHDLASAEEAKRLNIGARLSKIQFSRGGTRIAGFEAGSSTLRIWDVFSGQVLATCASSVEIFTFAWSQDGSLLALGGLDGKISLWDVSGIELDRWQAHPSVVSKIAFDHQGELLATEGWDGTMRLWEVASGRAYVTYASAASALQFSLDDQTLGCAHDVTNCQLLEVVHPTGYRRLANRLSPAGALDLDFTPDGHFAALAGSGGLRLVDLLTGQERRVLGSESYSVHLGAGTEPDLWSLTGEGLYHSRLRLGSQTSQRRLQVEPPELLFRHEHLTKCAFDGEGKKVVITSWQEGGAFLWNLQQGAAAPPRFCRQEAANLAAIDPEGRWAVTSASGLTRSYNVRVWDFSTGRLIRDWPESGFANLAASPDGHWLVTANETEFRLWDTTSWSPVPQVIPANPVFLMGVMAFSRDSRFLATYHDPAEIRIVEIPTLQLAGRLILPYPMRVAALRFSPSGDKFAAVETSGVIHLWDLRAIRPELKKLNLDWDLPSFLRVKDEPGPSERSVRLETSPFSLEEVAREIPARDTNAPASLIDLTGYYNAPLTYSWHSESDEHNDLSELPRGLQTFVGVRFDVRGLIQIAAKAAHGASYPSGIYSIPIGRPCRQLHFLHAAVETNARLGEQLGSYVIHYVDGHQIEIPILFGKDMADWWAPPDETDMTFVIAWTGRNPAASRFNSTIRLFKTTWENPRPAVPIRHFDFVSEKPTPSSPFLVAITAEP